MRHDGTQDPQEHLTAFKARMNLEGVATLAGPAIRWFNSLPQGSVTAFSDITRAFLAQFTTRIAKAKHSINLLGMTQRARELTRKYLDRFNDECLEIDGLTDSVASLCLTNGLLNEDFRKHLTTKPVWTMEVYQQIADKGILSRPRQLKDRTGENISLYCDYQKGYGHKTQDCFDLKDALEQTIWERKLADFSHLIGEPRRRENDRSSEDKSRIMRQSHVLWLHAALPKDRWFDDVTKNPPIVITARVGTGLVKRILVDMGADSNIMFHNVFDAVGLQDTNLRGHQHGVVGLGDNFIKPDGVVSLLVSIGEG
ncbi:uncharacterized protein LOC130957366 [Arachis stenosperma]|uniref:uncharacterized protein LOC130957366 n=1 Tax=Arachis stenosperma TaxID=217475 RepID=UPI0025ABEB80|nr:uncharacterized protein LOC130957366 [Arachis stenosperma]